METGNTVSGLSVTATNHQVEEEVDWLNLALSVTATNHRVEEEVDWLNLPDEITTIILLKVRQDDILEKVQYVCSSWYRLCKQPDLWYNIDLFPSESLIRQAHTDDVNDVYEDLLSYGYHRHMGKLKNHYVQMTLLAIDRSHGDLEGITVVSDVLFPGSYKRVDLSLFVANRLHFLGSRVRRLTIVYFQQSTLDDFFEALPTLPHLEVIEVIHCHFEVEPIEAISRNFPMLHTLRWFPNSRTRQTGCFYGHTYFRGCYGPLDKNAEAFAIAKHMPNLRHLSLHVNPLTDEGLQAILNACVQLESLELCDSLFLNLTQGSSLLGRCQKLKHFRLTDDPYMLDQWEYMKPLA